MQWTKKTLQLSVNFSLTPLFITFCASNFVMIWRHAVFVIVKYPMTKYCLISYRLNTSQLSSYHDANTIQKQNQIKSDFQVDWCDHTSKLIFKIC